MKIICVAFNYNSHNKEMNRALSANDDDPVLFLKPDTALLSGYKTEFYIPDFSSDIHYETEFVVKIDKMGKNIAERFAHRYYNEMTLGIDFTARDLQSDLRRKGLPWEISKSFDNSAVIGNFIPKDRFTKEVNNLNFKLKMNDLIVQSGNTSEMIHPVDKIISYASRFYTLKTGDLIFTGTPSGVGQVHVGDHLTGVLEEEELLNIKIS